MKKLLENRTVISILGWLVIVLCFCAAKGWINPDSADEITTFIITLLLARQLKMGVFYFIAALAMGKVFDGLLDPWTSFSYWEIIWDIGCIAGLLIYYYHRWKKPKLRKESRT